MDKINQEVINNLYDLIFTSRRHVIDTIEEELTRVTDTNTQTILIAIAAAFGILLILGIVIIWNQHKIKKMLRELQEQKTEDKP